MTDLKGFFAPLTPTGRSSVAPNMPWFYSGNLLTVEYLTDPANVRAILPPELELADEEPGAVAFICARRELRKTIASPLAMLQRQPAGAVS